MGAANYVKNEDFSNLVQKLETYTPRSMIAEVRQDMQELANREDLLIV